MPDEQDAESVAAELLAEAVEAQLLASWQEYETRQLAASPFDQLVIEDGQETYRAGFQAGVTFVIRQVVDRLVVGGPPGAMDGAPGGSTGTGWPPGQLAAMAGEAEAAREEVAEQATDS